jgi:polyvinyl alcohol dehydrogenase (cytochrome)
MIRPHRIALQAIATIATFAVLAAPSPTQPPDGAAIFAARCASCHDGDPGSRAPVVESLKERSPESIIDALTGGAMRYQGLALSGAERRAVAEHITGKVVNAAKSVDPNIGMCAKPTPLGANPVMHWNGWSPTLENTHAVDAKVAGLTAADLPKLTLKWAFGFREATSSWSQPTIVGDRLFVGSQNGSVYALDRKSGCTIWRFEARGGVRGSIVIGRGSARTGRLAAYFSDQVGYVYALDAEDGSLIWSKQVDDHPLIRLTGTPALYDGRLYVPTSSYEEAGKSPDYPCCTFRGSIVALAVANGTEIWRTYMVDEIARVMGKNKQGVDSLGPSGGAIWSAPTVDVKRQLLYVATGNTYSGVTQPKTDAIVAMDLMTGKIAWTKQLHPDDVFGCRPGEPNCGTRSGPDYDFGASPVIARTRQGRDVIIVGQKSGVGYALDPGAHGAVLWEYRAGRGGALGGIEWGVAADDQHAYFPVADNNSPQPGGLHAAKLTTGERVWFAAPQPPICGGGRGCTAAQSAAITVIPGAVLSGAFDGAVRGYSTKDGSVIWSFDTNREFLTANGVRARGASLNGPAPVVVGGMIYVSSGDYRGRPGNVLLALGFD